MALGSSAYRETWQAIVKVDCSRRRAATLAAKRNMVCGVIAVAAALRFAAGVRAPFLRHHCLALV